MGVAAEEEFGKLLLMSESAKIRLGNKLAKLLFASNRIEKEEKIRLCVCVSLARGDVDRPLRCFGIVDNATQQQRRGKINGPARRGDRNPHRF